MPNIPESAELDCSQTEWRAVVSASRWGADNAAILQRPIWQGQRLNQWLNQEIPTYREHIDRPSALVAPTSDGRLVQESTSTSWEMYARAARVTVRRGSASILHMRRNY